jgi:hypothetical protein
MNGPTMGPDYWNENLQGPKPVGTHNHGVVQHRDGKPPWCPTCGLTAEGEVPVSRFERADDKGMVGHEGTPGHSMQIIKPATDNIKALIAESRNYTIWLPKRPKGKVELATQNEVKRAVLRIADLVDALASESARADAAELGVEALKAHQYAIIAAATTNITAERDKLAEKVAAVSGLLDGIPILEAASAREPWMKVRIIDLEVIREVAAGKSDPSEWVSVACGMSFPNGVKFEHSPHHWNEYHEGREPLRTPHYCNGILSDEGTEQ